jgi:protein SCO1/2
VKAKAILLLMFLVALTMVFSAQGASGHERELPDDILKKIGVDEKPGGQVPPGLVFTDSKGKTVRLKDFLEGGPVLLTLNYYTCPMLCPLILRNLIQAAERMGGISLSRDYRIVTVSIDPHERIESAAARAEEMHSMLQGVKEPASRWPFLSGGKDEIGKLTDAVGFRYAKAGDEFAHPNVVIVLTAEGKISRYLYGVEQEPRDLKLALIEAADGRIGESSMLNRALMFCFHYDPVEKRYALYARNLMKGGGILTLLFVGVVYLALWRRRMPRTET